MTMSFLGGTYTPAGTSLTLARMGYGAMQLAGPHVFGPPRDRDAALAVLRAAVDAGINHIDTSDFYGPHLTNELIREALSPYPDGLTIGTKIGALRDAEGAWLPAMTPDELRAAVESNRRHLDRDVLDIVNLRMMTNPQGPVEGSIARELEVVAEMQAKGLIRHIGLSSVTPTQVEEGRGICQIVCVQNQYNLAHRNDDALIEQLAKWGIAYVPFFPLGGFNPIQSDSLSDVAARLDAKPIQVALAWLLQRSPNILLIPGTSSVAHLHENIAAASLPLSAETMAQLDAIGTSPAE